MFETICARSLGRRPWVVPKICILPLSGGISGRRPNRSRLLKSVLGCRVGAQMWSPGFASLPGLAAFKRQFHRRHGMSSVSRAFLECFSSISRGKHASRVFKILGSLGSSKKSLTNNQCDHTPNEIAPTSHTSSSSKYVDEDSMARFDFLSHLIPRRLCSHRKIHRCQFRKCRMTHTISSKTLETHQAQIASAFKHSREKSSTPVSSHKSEENKLTCILLGTGHHEFNCSAVQCVMRVYTLPCRPHHHSQAGGWISEGKNASASSCCQPSL